MMENRRYDDSALEQWIRKNCITTNQFCVLAKCSRVTAWRLKQNLGVTAKLAARIEALTNGEVKPIVAPRGRRW